MIRNERELFDEFSFPRHLLHHRDRLHYPPSWIHALRNLHAPSCDILPDASSGASAPLTVDCPSMLPLRPKLSNIFWAAGTVAAAVAVVGFW